MSVLKLWEQNEGNGFHTFGVILYVCGEVWFREFDSQEERNHFLNSCRRIVK
jgi:hypothetical protein